MARSPACRQPCDRLHQHDEQRESRGIGGDEAVAIPCGLEAQGNVKKGMVRRDWGRPSSTLRLAGRGDARRRAAGHGSCNPRSPSRRPPPPRPRRGGSHRAAKATAAVQRATRRPAGTVGPAGLFVGARKIHSCFDRAGRVVCPLKVLGLKSFLQRWPDAPRWLACAAAVGIFTWNLTLFYLPGQGFTYMIQFGSMEHGRYLPELKAVNHHYRACEDRPGTTSQWYAQIAMRPHLGDPVLNKAVDGLKYRSRRRSCFRSPHGCSPVATPCGR